MVVKLMKLREDSFLGQDKMPGFKDDRTKNFYFKGVGLHGRYVYFSEKIEACPFFVPI